MPEEILEAGGFSWKRQTIIHRQGTPDQVGLWKPEVGGITGMLLGGIALNFRLVFKTF